MRWPAFVRNTHKWFGLIIGMQVVLWTLSGLYMTAVHLDIIHVDYLVRSIAPWPNDLSRLVEPGVVVIRQPSATVHLETQLDQPVYVVVGGTEQVHGVRLRPLHDRYAYEVKAATGTAMFDAANGQRLAIDASVARRLATAAYVGEGQVTAVEMVTQHGLETRGLVLPLWKATFDDADNTTLYVATANGEVVERRNDTWRLWDAFWMLHIMDYSSRTSFNHPLIVTVATGVAWLALSGGYPALSQLPTIGLRLGSGRPWPFSSTLASAAGAILRQFLPCAREITLAMALDTASMPHHCMRADIGARIRSAALLPGHRIRSSTN